MYSTSDLRFISFLKILAYFAVSLLLLFFLTLLFHSWPTISQLGFSFFTSSLWDPLHSSFSALPFLLGTFVTSFVALCIAMPIAFSFACVLGFFLKRGFLYQFLSLCLEILSGIPSVIYGFWALYVLVPLVRQFALAVDALPYGVSVLTASIVLAVMIIPYAASLSREMIALVPNELKEAAIALGATPSEVLFHVVIPYARSGLFSGMLLSLSRALGETMAVTMVIGNANRFFTSLFEPGNTIASLLANEFAEASSDFYVSALLELGLILFVVSVFVNIVGQFICSKLRIDKL